ncbi:MAG: hypothetical protein SF029_13005 [bacterium]|nr:hypothetical protein [bacterium]
MPIEVRWNTEDQELLCYQFDGKWTWDDLYEAVHQANLILDAVERPTPVIVDVSGISGIPSGAMSQASGLMRRSHPNISFTVIVGANRFVRMMADMFTKLRPQSPHTYYFVTTLEEAYRVIQEKQVAEPDEM